VLGSSSLPQHQIDDPAPANVNARLAAVGEDVGVLAPGFFERIRQYRQCGKVACLLHPGGKADRVFGSPRVGERSRGERFLADYVAVVHEHQVEVANLENVPVFDWTPTHTRVRNVAVVQATPATTHILDEDLIVEFGQQDVVSADRHPSVIEEQVGRW